MVATPLQRPVFKSWKSLPINNTPEEVRRTGNRVQVRKQDGNRGLREEESRECRYIEEEAPTTIYRRTASRDRGNTVAHWPQLRYPQSVIEARFSWIRPWAEENGDHLGLTKRGGRSPSGTTGLIPNAVEGNKYEYE